MLIKSHVVKSYHNQSLSRVDQLHGLSIRGVVNSVGLPVPCRVRLYEKISGQLVADIKTDEQGVYEFRKLLEKKYFLVAHHPTSQFNAVIQDNVVPK